MQYDELRQMNLISISIIFAIRIHGNVYSSFIWKFTDPKDYLSFDEFLSESIDLEFMSLCVFFVFFGSCGMFLNGRRIYEFCRAKTVNNIHFILF